MRLRALVCVALLAAAGGCASIDPWQDARIEAEVKAHLVAEKSANLTRVGVVSREGTVYLSGTVMSADERALAAALAQDVKGVRRIVNTLHLP